MSSPFQAIKSNICGSNTIIIRTNVALTEAAIKCKVLCKSPRESHDTLEKAYKDKAQTITIIYE